VQVKECVNGNVQTEEHNNTYQAILKENNEFNKITKSDLDKLAVTSNLRDNEVSKLRSDIK